MQIVSAWTAPLAVAPGGNVGAPITTSGDDQVKLGKLSVGTGAVPAGNLSLLVGTGVGATEYCDENGANCLDIANVQNDVTGSCAAGSSIRIINDDGTVTCEPDDSGTMTGQQIATGLNGRLYLRTHTLGSNNTGVPSASCFFGDRLISVVTAACPGGIGGLESFTGGSLTGKVYCDIDGNATFDGGTITIMCLNP